MTRLLYIKKKKTIEYKHYFSSKIYFINYHLNDTFIIYQKKKKNNRI